VRILHVTPFYEPFWAYGGMARCSAALSRALARRGAQVTVATALLDRSAPIEEVADGVRVLRYPGPEILKRFLVPWAHGLRAFLRRELSSFDIVHLHGHRNGLAVTTSRALTAVGRSWVLLPNGTFPHHHQHRAVKALFDRLLGNTIVKRAAALVAVSQAEARDLPRPARVIPNGVTPCGTPAPPAWRSRPRVLFVGTDRPQKRGQILPDLLAALPDAELKLVGRFGAPFLARFAPFGARVVVSGVLAGDALASAYADADVLVHPAVGEAFGLVPFEAALAGTPAVVAGGHGCGEWYGRAGGCVVPPDDLGAMTSAVLARLEGPLVARQEARTVAEFAVRELTWDRAAEATEALYREVLEARK
jgi:glycosyltransferase involved in cell wall biosynthesis